MAVHCKNEKELGEAIKNEEEEIEMDIDIGKKVIRIKAVGKVAWGICAAALTAAIASIIATVAAPPSAPATVPTGAVAFGGTAAILGTAAIPAISIGVAAGGIGGLTALRDKYKIVEKDDKHVKLKRK